MNLATVGRGSIPPTRVHELDAVVVGAGGAGLAAALRCALDAPAADYAQRASAALAPFSPAAVDAVVRHLLLPRLLGP